ncbi:hypothetical protein [Nostoc sp. NZL]|uniref:hypothetical protein n=1 Tax=Nostoc sp. NZL TaxID=2650612 RepID=UPI0018C82BD6|nr:hypothetical protein [Nostoc sp. NZL]
MAWLRVKSWTTSEIIWAKLKAGWNQIFALHPLGTQVQWRGMNLITGYERSNNLSLYI